MRIDVEVVVLKSLNWLAFQTEANLRAADYLRKNSKEINYIDPLER